METIDLIKKSLDYFDNQNHKFNKYLGKDFEILLKENKIRNKNNQTFTNINFEVLGIFHHSSKVFIWGWVVPYLSIDKTKISRELLNYGLNLDPRSNNIDQFYLKSLFNNSRIYIENDFDLDLIQAISSYLLKNKIDFIRKGNLKLSDDDNLITIFYLIKIIE